MVNAFLPLHVSQCCTLQATHQLMQHRHTLVGGCQLCFDLQNLRARVAGAVS